ncbi:MAG: hypothetical protein C0621_10305 [Desulfuromonas sp.]|nr:MAG: hypothetical protein C0621_10305 [Desulfuromonas sp.]
MATILLVDDVALFLELEKSFLEGQGHTLFEAHSAEAALEVMAETPPDLLLLDLYMPGLDGDELCLQLRQEARWQGLKIIMVTAAGKEEDVRKCLAAGCDDYITKPVNKNELNEKVQRLLGGLKGRTSPRVRKPLRVRIKGGEKALEAQVRDISLNGIYVKSSRLLDLETVVEISLELPDGEQLNLLGKVKRQEQKGDKGMGIYLVHPDSDGVESLEALILRGDEEEGAIVESFTGSFEEKLGALEKRSRRLEEENERLRERIDELEEENLDFAQQLVQTDEVNNNLTNLYIASSRLHSVLDRKEVASIIKEVVINFVGAEKFALLLMEKGHDLLHYETGEGFEEGSFPDVRPGDGILWEALEKDSPHYEQGSVLEGSDDLRRPLAAIPLRIHGESMGLLAIYRLFIQKERFAQVDYQLFTMLAEHAVTALFSSSLYEASERKRETYRGFMDLLLN